MLVDHPHRINPPPTPSPRTRAPRQPAPPRAWLALLPALLAAGCLDFEQRLTLEKNGELTFSLRYAVPVELLPAYRDASQTISRWQGVEAGQQIGVNAWLDRRTAEDHFTGDTLKLTAYQTFEKEASRHIEVGGRATDAEAALRGGKLGPFELGPHPDGGRELALPLPSASAKIAALDEVQKQHLASLATGFAWRLVVDTPTPIISTNGNKLGERRVEWRFGPKILADPTALPTRLSVVFQP